MERITKQTTRTEVRQAAGGQGPAGLLLHPAGEVKAVGGISYDLNYDEVMGIVGESGSGKSVEAYSDHGPLQSPGKVIGGPSPSRARMCWPRRRRR